jgi:hypothetical protein
LSRWNPQAPIDRLMAMVSPEPMSGCWLWIGSCLPNGYSHMGIQVDGVKKTVYGHRLAYELLKGRIPEGLDLDHLCRVRCCVNPDHLEPVTRKVNLNRGVGFGTTNFCIRGHELTPENTYLHKRKNYVARECRSCIRLRGQR